MDDKKTAPSTLSKWDSQTIFTNIGVSSVFLYIIFGLIYIYNR
nr:MAG TPA: hypothetical protein [Caudoviricetes sp.]